MDSVTIRTDNISVLDERSLIEKLMIAQSFFDINVIKLIEERGRLGEWSSTENN